MLHSRFEAHFVLQGEKPSFPVCPRNLYTVPVHPVVSTSYLTWFHVPIWKEQLKELILKPHPFQFDRMIWPF